MKKTVLISGSSRGLGASIAKTFYEESVEKGNGDFLISELIQKEKY